MVISRWRIYAQLKSENEMRKFRYEKEEKGKKEYKSSVRNLIDDCEWFNGDPHSSLMIFAFLLHYIIHLQHLFIAFI